MAKKHTFYEKYVKRALDVILSFSALLFLALPMLVVAVLVRIKLGTPVIFCQERPGKDEKIFRLYKFRTMTDARDENGDLLPDEVRLTKFGKLLRSTSLDELPELWNILKGEMSIVGPRPLLVKYLPLYNEEQKHRHDARPGLTGWAQVHGRNLQSWEERFEHDVWYVNNVSFATDLKTVFLTVKCVFSRKGVSSDTSVTMDEFSPSQSTLCREVSNESSK